MAFNPHDTSLNASSDTALNNPSNNEVLTFDSSTNKWKNKSLPAAPVISVNTRTGAISLTSSDVGLGNADNTADANKPISTATQTALNAKLAASNNLSDLASASTARTNLGLGAAATASIDTANGVAGLDGSAKLKSSEMPDSVQAIIVEANGSYPLRSTVTSSSTRPVIWRGADAPTIGSGYAINDVDTWEPIS